MSVTIVAMCHGTPCAVEIPFDPQRTRPPTLQQIRSIAGAVFSFKTCDTRPLNVAPEPFVLGDSMFIHTPGGSEEWRPLTLESQICPQCRILVTQRGKEFALTTTHIAYYLAAEAEIIPWLPAYMQRNILPKNSFDNYNEVFCPITMELMRDPVTAEDGFTYECEAIWDWITHHRRSLGAGMPSPITGKNMGTTLVRNDAVAVLSRKYLERIIEVYPDRSTITVGHEYERNDILSAQMFEDIDKFLGCKLLSSSLRSPTIVVLGNESHGKSTLLERIIQCPVFPRGEHLTTRMPVRVSLRRGPFMCSVADSDKPPRYCALSRVSDYVLELMQRLTVGAGQDVTDKEIKIEIHTPTAPFLTLLDVPGLVAVRTHGQSQNVPQVTRDLAKSIIQREKDNAMFLLVVEVHCPPNQCLAAPLIQDDIRVTSNTLGVFTKLDAMIPNDQQVQKLISGTSHGALAVGHRWVACASPQTDDARLTDIHRLHNIDCNETTYLQAKYSNLPSHVNECLGIASVRRTLQKFYMNFIRTTWINQLGQVIRTIRVDAVKQMTALGLPYCITQSDELSRLYRELSQFQLAPEEHCFVTPTLTIQMLQGLFQAVLCHPYNVWNPKTPYQPLQEQFWFVGFDQHDPCKLRDVLVRFNNNPAFAKDYIIATIRKQNPQLTRFSNYINEITRLYQRALGETTKSFVQFTDAMIATITCVQVTYYPHTGGKSENHALTESFRSQLPHMIFKRWIEGCVESALTAVLTEISSLQYDSHIQQRLLEDTAVSQRVQVMKSMKEACDLQVFYLELKQRLTGPN